MNTLRNSFAVNHMITALQIGMSPTSDLHNAETDVLFMGGGVLSEIDERTLAGFGLRKNYNIIYATCETLDARPAPSTYHAVITDGQTQAYILSNGRLWKRDRKSASLLVFADTQAVIKISRKGRIVVTPMAGRYHDHGYDLAHTDVAARTAREPGHAPVVAPVGNITTVMDAKAFVAMFAAAA